jgi:hypothetical protein
MLCFDVFYFLHMDISPGKVREPNDIPDVAYTWKK